MLCLALVACLAGCASKNPLMDDAPAAAGASASKPASVATAAAPTAETKTTAAAAPGSDTHTTGPTGYRRFLGIFAPYRVDVQQGNFVSREMVDQLREGMQRPEGVTREQVRFVLGTPLLTDVFHADRWDYVFRLQKKSGEVISSHVTAFFQNNRLTRIDGGNLPTEQEYLAHIAGSAPGAPSTANTKK
ncbi:outer membrane protein assembly factor BamE [Noviherbaspirillum cavernae]|nr:outer membrane protein assembly factor BamE [Noviherbaspirillum cavernae]